MNRKKYACAALAVFLLLALFAGTIYEKHMTLQDTFPESSTVSGEALSLYARAAVLMDADSGRILYGKNAEEVLPMASTTKIMTLIVALELAGEGEIAQVSALAAGQPKVRLGMRPGEQYFLTDLYYSLMLESHNDTAVCIAENIGKRLGKTDDSKEAVGIFVKQMNEKAKALGLLHTWFITPNGLDAEEVQPDGSKRIHATTAAELAAILRYCILDSPMREAFLAITGTGSHTFSDLAGKRSFTCVNHNQLLQMMDGALTGKTGFTAKAGYCYVGAVRQDEKTLIVALLACGWPNNKSYKWADAKTLLCYGLDHYTRQDVYQKDLKPEPLPLSGGAPDDGSWVHPQSIELALAVPEEEQTLPLLMREDETVEVIYEGSRQLYAPVKKGTVVGMVRYMLGDLVLAEYPVYTAQSAEAFGFGWCLNRVLEKYLFIYSKEHSVL